MRRRRGESGQVAIELIGNLWWLLLGALIAWQILLGAYTAISAENAARDISRVVGRGGDARKAMDDALSGPLKSRDNRLKVQGDRVELKVAVPIVVPGIHISGLDVTGTAELPGN